MIISLRGGHFLCVIRLFDIDNVIKLYGSPGIKTMATALNEDDEPTENSSTYDQLWKEAVDIDDEVRRILLEHGTIELPQQRPSEDDEGEYDEQ